MSALNPLHWREHCCRTLQSSLVLWEHCSCWGSCETPCWFTFLRESLILPYGSNGKYSLQVDIEDSTRNYETVQTLLDSASQASFITEHCR
ncbi:hypothetical protein PR048_010109 [Dryococelus australis]|uniref:Uncharacterized protein n=1 Tax=Dryococelus australis TaxID=614101 RepID=A0ABQ9I1S3_9NEOP|nr:hypothetical protein PR048_010109 [Dryococelus australis]